VSRRSVASHRLIERRTQRTSAGSAFGPFDFLKSHRVLYYVIFMFKFDSYHQVESNESGRDCSRSRTEVRLAAVAIALAPFRWPPGRSAERRGSSCRTSKDTKTTNIIINLALSSPKPINRNQSKSTHKPKQQSCHHDELSPRRRFLLLRRRSCSPRGATAPAQVLIGGRYGRRGKAPLRTGTVPRGQVSCFVFGKAWIPFDSSATLPVDNTTR